MTNTTLLANMIKRYDNLAFTHNYLLGFADRGIVYFTLANSNALPYVCSLQTASRGAGVALVYRPNKSQKEYLKTYNLTPLCSLKYFEELVANSKYNRGELFEKLVTEYYGQTWEKDNIPFTKSGDLIIDGTHYQVKYNKATFTNEQILNNLEVKVN